jgi:hypothetical protein
LVQSFHLYNEGMKEDFVRTSFDLSFLCLWSENGFCYSLYSRLLWGSLLSSVVLWKGSLPEIVGTYCYDQEHRTKSISPLWKLQILCCYIVADCIKNFTRSRAKSLPSSNKTFAEVLGVYGWLITFNSGPNRTLPPVTQIFVWISQHCFASSSVAVIHSADRGRLTVSVMDPYGRIVGFLDRIRYFFFRVAPKTFPSIYCTLCFL